MNTYKLTAVPRYLKESTISTGLSCNMLATITLPFMFLKSMHSSFVLSTFYSRKLSASKRCMSVHSPLFRIFKNTFSRTTWQCWWQYKRLSVHLSHRKSQMVISNFRSQQDYTWLTCHRLLITNWKHSVTVEVDRWTHHVWSVYY